MTLSELKMKFDAFDNLFNDMTNPRDMSDGNQSRDMIDDEMDSFLREIYIMSTDVANNLTQSNRARIQSGINDRYFIPDEVALDNEYSDIPWYGISWALLIICSFIMLLMAAY